MAHEIRRIFKQHGLSPKKWMGQNLLVDTSYLERIVQAAEVEPGEAIVEVGAGLGILTDALLTEGANVWAIEVDAGFFRILEERFLGRQGVTLVHDDALKHDFRALAASLGRLRVVANLPYNISSRLIFMFQENSDIFGSLCILLQKEVAERLEARPGTKDYGVLTVLLGISATVELLFNIPGRAFYPVPEVTSTMVRVSFLEKPRFPVADPAFFTRLVKAAFSGRRKTLRNSLRNSRIPLVSSDSIPDAAREAEIDLSRRGETLTPEEFARFADSLHERLGEPPDRLRGWNAPQ
ncbi:16S rRNA (adenine(1518)-N(6)/adenine(1519)-N(6))-dimethyltransferase RsmA [Thermodesulfobacteriota bacterium]